MFQPSQPRAPRPAYVASEAPRSYGRRAEGEAGEGEDGVAAAGETAAGEPEAKRRRRTMHKVVRRRRR